MRFFRSRKEVDAETLETRRDVLRARGVPEAFVEDLATRRESWLGFAGGIAALPPLLLLLWGWWLAFERLMVVPWTRLERVAAAQGAWLYGLSNPFYWIGLLVGLFLVLMFFGWLWSLLYLRNSSHPGPSVAASILRDGSAGEGAALTDWLYRRSAIHAGEAGTAAEFLDGFGRSQLRLWGVCTLVLAAVTGSCLAIGVQGYWLAGESGIVHHELGRSERLVWRDAIGVTTGCNHTEDDEVLIYEARFNGWTADLGSNGSSTEGIPLSVRVEGLEHVDAELRAAEVSRGLWQWRARDSLHPACVGYWASKAGADGAGRIRGLLAAP